MTKRSWVVLTGVSWMLLACGGTKEPAESPTSAASNEEGTTSQATLESGPMTTVGDEAPPEAEVSKQELPCPGKNARYWDTGLVKSEVLTEDCGINGQSFPAGTLIEFDEDGQLLTE
jgi:hypothetical protein